MRKKPLSIVPSVYANSENAIVIAASRLSGLNVSQQLATARQITTLRIEGQKLTRLGLTQAHWVEPFRIQHDQQLVFELVRAGKQGLTALVEN